MQFFKERKKTRSVIELAKDGFSLVGSDNLAERHIAFAKQVNNLDYDPKFTEFTLQLKPLIEQYHLKNTHCSLVLQHDFYHVFSLNQPKVPREEQYKAIRWQIKDLCKNVGYSLDDVVYDLFYPGDGDKRLYVVVTSKSRLTKIALAIRKSGLILDHIYIAQFALRDLLLLGDWQKYIEENPLGILEINDSETTISLIYQNEIYFIRRIAIGREKILNEPTNEFINEIENSWEYCHTEMQLEWPKHLLIIPNTNQYLELLTSALQPLTAKTQLIFSSIDRDFNWQKLPNNWICYSTAVGALFNCEEKA